MSRLGTGHTVAFCEPCLRIRHEDPVRPVDVLARFEGVVLECVGCRLDERDAWMGRGRRGGSRRRCGFGRGRRGGSRRRCGFRGGRRGRCGCRLRCRSRGLSRRRGGTRRSRRGYGSGSRQRRRGRQGGGRRCRLGCRGGGWGRHDRRRGRCGRRRWTGGRAGSGCRRRARRGGRLARVLARGGGDQHRERGRGEDEACDGRDSGSGVAAHADSVGRGAASTRPSPPQRRTQAARASGDGDAVHCRLLGPRRRRTCRPLA